MWAVLAIVGGIVVSQVAAPAGDDLKLEVRRLLRQIELSSQVSQRDAAEEKLTVIGEPVLNLLPPPSEKVAPEVRVRVERVRQAIQRAMAKAAVQASTVTLHGDAIPLAKVLAAFQEQTGNKIVVPEAGGPVAADLPIKVEFEKTPFWQALDEVLDQAGLSAYPFADQKAIVLQPRLKDQRPRAGRASYSGPFRFEAVQVEAKRDLRNPANRALVVTLETAWEPRLSPIVLEEPLKKVTATDENGRLLAVAGAESEPEVDVTPDAMAKLLPVPLVLPSREVKQIALLKGTINAILPSKIETFRFKDLEKAKDVSQRAAGVTVVLESVRRNNQLWEVRIRVRFDDAGEALQSHRNWIFENEAFLEGADGKPVPYAAYETTMQNKTEVGMAYMFSIEEPLKDFRFVYKTAGMILNAELDYELKDIPLP